MSFLQCTRHDPVLAPDVVFDNTRTKLIRSFSQYQQEDRSNVSCQFLRVAKQSNEDKPCSYNTLPSSFIFHIAMPLAMLPMRPLIMPPPLEAAGAGAAAGICGAGGGAAATG